MLFVEVDSDIIDIEGVKFAERELKKRENELTSKLLANIIEKRDLDSTFIKKKLREIFDLVDDKSLVVR